MSLEALKRNGHNLDLNGNRLVGAYGIPAIEPVHTDKWLEWIRFNHALREPKRARYGVHFFIDDYLFERAWHDPKRYALFLSDFPAVLSPDFSMFSDYPRAVQIYNHWRKHLLASYWQRLGLTVIPTVGWVDRDSFSWCFDGEPVNSVVAVSSVGTQKNPDSRKMFLDGYTEMLARLNPERILFFGPVPAECEGNIEPHTPYYETFTRGRAFFRKA